MSDQPTFSFDEAPPRFVAQAEVVPAAVPSRNAGGPSKGAELHRHKHRDRLRARFTEGGADAVPDYELLEMILYRAIPRGDPTPSEADVQMTFAIRDAAEVFNIAIHDHLVIGKARELSFRAEGYL